MSDFEEISPSKESDFKLPKPRLPSNLGKRLREDLSDGELSTESSKRSNCGDLVS